MALDLDLMGAIIYIYLHGTILLAFPQCNKSVRLKPRVQNNAYITLWNRGFSRFSYNLILQPDDIFPYLLTMDQAQAGNLIR